MTLRIPGIRVANLALRNVFRQKMRTALTLAIIAAGVAGLILSGGFVEHSLVSLRETTIHAQLGHLQIYRKGYFAEGKRSPYKYLIERPEQVLSVARGIPEIKNVMSRLSFAGVLNNGKSDYAIFGEGVEPTKEAALGTQLQVIGGRKLEAKDRFAVMIGEGVASGMNLHDGDTVNLLLNTEEGALNNLEFTIVGIFRTFSKDYDAHAIRIALPDAQELLASSAINAVVVELNDTSETDRVAAAIAAKLDPAQFEVKTWRDLADFYEQTAALFKRQFAFLQATILLSVLLSVANSVNMTIFERTGEFGTLMALGTRRGPIFQLVVLENAFVGLLGSTVGVILGVLLGGLVNALKLPLPPPPNSNSGYFAGIVLGPGLVATAFFVGAIATPLISLLPARRIARVPVVDALRMN
jgi:putative ABC transport system permease protein